MLYTALAILRMFCTTRPNVNYWENHMSFHPWQNIKRFLPTSLFARSLIILVMPLVLVQIILGYIFFDRHTETILRVLSTTIAGDIALVLDWVERDPNMVRIQELSKRNLNLDVELERNKKLDKKGLQRKTWLNSFMEEALCAQVSADYFLRMDHDFIYLTVESKKGLLHIKTSRKRLFSRTTPLVIFWTTGSALLLFIVAALFMRNQIRPIRRLAQAADAFGRGDEDVLFKPEGATEVRKAGYAFLLMRDRLRRQLSDRLEMLAGISHDLRTPLTRLKLQLALMPETKENTGLLGDVVIMQQMVEGFLEYAQGAQEEAITPLQPFKYINQIAEPFRSKLKILINCSEIIKISIKPLLINRCLTNLLLNCERYAKSVALGVELQSHHVVITVDDDGPGIPEHERGNVFKAFYRLDAARRVDQGGIGLGLAIVRDSVRMHGGQVQLSDSPLGGLRVTIRLPQ